MGVDYNRQYIGARYVPTFFNNPDGSWDWAPGFQYEPLTIVKYGTNTFTSKKLVPDNIGTPNIEKDYWAMTGDYNGAILALTKDTTTCLYGFETFDSIGANDVQPGMIIETKGYYQKYDGGGFRYIINETIGLKISEGIYAYPVNNGEVPITAMGAKSGEDCTKSLEEVLNIAKVALIPEGTFIVNNFTPPINSTIKGLNNKSSILMGTILNTPILNFNESTFYCTVENLRLARNSHDGIGIKVDYSGHTGYPSDPNHLFRNLTGGDMGNHIYLTQSARGIKIESCNFEGASNYSIYCGGTDNFISNADIHNCEYGMLVLANNIITNVKIWYCNDAGIVINGNQNLMSNISVQDCNYGILFRPNSSKNIIEANLDKLGHFSKVDFGLRLESMNKYNKITISFTNSIDASNVLLAHSNCANNDITIMSDGTPIGDSVNRDFYLANNVIYNNTVFKDKIITTTLSEGSIALPKNAKDVILNLNLNDRNLTRSFSLSLNVLSGNRNYSFSYGSASCLINVNDYVISLNEVTGNPYLYISYK